MESSIVGDANRIFVVGYSGSGTRVVSAIAREAGMNIGNGNHLSDALDLYTTSECISDFISSGAPYDNPETALKLRRIVEQDTEHSRNWCVKNGEFLLAVRGLRRAWDDLKIILVVRHGLDNILNHFAYETSTEHDYQRILPPADRILFPVPSPPVWFPYPQEDASSICRMVIRARIWNEMHRIFLEDHVRNVGSSYILRLENIVLDPVGETQMLLDFMELDGDATSLSRLIRKEVPSIGRRFSPHPIGPEGGWYRPERDIRPLERIMDNILQRLGYPHYSLLPHSKEESQ